MNNFRMGGPSNPSLLEYARFYGIASDPTAIDPIAYIDETHKIPTSEPQPKQVIEQLQNTRQIITQSLLKEKLDVKKEGARFLSTVIQDATARTEDFNWGDILPAFDRIGGLQLETPIFPAEHDTNTLLSRRPLRYEGCELQLEPLQEPPSDETFPNLSADSINEAMHNTKSEKLNCSKEAFMLIQRAKDCSGPAKEALENLLIDEWRLCQDDLIFPELPPLVLSHVDKTYLRSHSPATKLQMLPSPTSPLLLPKCKSRTGSFPQHQRHYQREVAYIKLNPGVRNGFHKEGTGYTEPADELNDAPGSGNLHEASLSGQDSVDYNHDAQAQAVPEVIIHIEEPLSSFIRSTLDKDPQSHTSVNRISGADGPPKLNINEIPIGAAISSTDASIPSTSKKPVAADKEVYSYVTRSTISEQNDKHEISQECTNHSPEKSPQNILNSLLGISPSQSICQSQSLEQSQEEKSPNHTNHTQNKPSDKLHLELKYRGLSKHKSLLPRKRKRGKAQEDLQARQKRTHQTKEFQGEETSQAPLGSLSTFLEIRGRTKSHRPVLATSRYFTDPQPIDRVELNDTTTTTEETTVLVQDAFTDSVPQIQRPIDQQSYLFVSTALLKTHLSLVQYIEKAQKAPTVIYRDYETTIRQVQPKCSSMKILSQPDARHALPKEADIIISPSTAVILTSSQALTQLYLPGHKPKNPKISDLKCVNSPLREQILLLSSRYEHLYMLISHATSSTKGPQEFRCSTWTVDKRTLSSFASLLAFCNSMDDCIKIVPLWVPSSPETLAKWILSLHDKHAVGLPHIGIEKPQNGFTPVNLQPKPQVPGVEHNMEETIWEQFMRRVGLNPYAAQAVLLILNEERIAMEVEGSGSSHKQGKSSGALSVFLQLSPGRRRELFGRLIGEEIVNRVSQMIEKDWQCDWALDFNYSA